MKIIIKECVLALSIALASTLSLSSVAEEYPKKMLELVIHSDGDRMPAMMYQASGKGPHPTVVLLHGMPGNERSLDIAQDARTAGFNVLYFNYRGAWGAEGEYRFTNLDDDAAAAIQYLRDNAQKLNVDVSSITTLGHSIGGFVSLLTGSKDKGVRCIAAMAPGNPHAFIDKSTGKPNTFLSEYANTLFMLKGLNSASLEQDLRDVPRSESDATLFANALAGRPVLVVAGKQDNITPLAMINPMIDAYKLAQNSNVTAHRIEGDHSFSSTREQLSKIVVDWLTRECKG